MFKLFYNHVQRESQQLAIANLTDCHVSLSLFVCRQPQEEEREPTPPPEQELTESDLERIEKEVEDLQDEFDKAVVEKHSLELELTSMKERLKAATDLMQR